MGESAMLPGFRFHPTDAELAEFYLKKKLLGIKFDPEVIAEVNINNFTPWDLPAKSILSGDRKCYFFSPISKKYSSGPRMNRATETGCWKGTGNDREVKYKGRKVAMRKTLIFYNGRPSKDTRTNWVMHEYRMEDEDLANQGVPQDEYVICKVYKKSGIGPKNGAQYGAAFEEEHCNDDERSSVTSVMTFGVLVNPNNIASCSPLMNITTSTEQDLSTVTPLTVVDPNNIASTSGPSTITSCENERVTVTVIDDVVVNDYVMLTHGDLAAMLCDNNTQEVEDTKGKKVMTDDGIDSFDDGIDMTNIFRVEEFADYTLPDPLWK